MDNNTLRSLNFAMQLGFSLAGPLLIFIGGGIFLDSKLHTAPVFILIGVALGLAGSAFALYDLVRKLPSSRRSSRDRPAPPK